MSDVQLSIYLSGWIYVALFLHQVPGDHLCTHGTEDKLSSNISLLLFTLVSDNNNNNGGKVSGETGTISFGAVLRHLLKTSKSET